MDTLPPLPSRGSLEEIEEGNQLQPKFDANGLIPCVTQDATSREVLMVGVMNAEALALTIATREAHYWSRSRQKLWHKGEQSGLVQHVVKILIDDDQDCVLLQVEVDGGASCHVGYRSCFFRALKEDGPDPDFELEFLESEKVFDPNEVYQTAQDGTPLQK
ncbi:MAG: phosphoribosyl-AMP cyclohydrolase [Bacteroidota bacterium]